MARLSARLQREALQRRRQPCEPRVEARGAGTAHLGVQLQRPQPRQVFKVRASLPPRQTLSLSPLKHLCLSKERSKRTHTISLHHAAHVTY